jgi:FkbM family methyltransferase
MNLLSAVRRRFHPLHTLRKNSAFRAVVRHFDPMVTVRPSGFQRRMYCRLLTHASMLVADEEVEPGIRRTFAAVAKEIGSDHSFWDVGANIGIFTFTFAEIQPTLPVISVEPDEKNLACLRRTSTRWRLSQHRIFAGVAGESDGEVTFHLDEASGATGSIEAAETSFNSRHYKAEQRAVSVSMRSLDSMAKEFQIAPGLIKIDVEGAEVRVLNGAKSVIHEYWPVIFLETFENAEECRCLLRPNGYQFFDADRLGGATERTTNFLCIVPGKAHVDTLMSLRSLGYPITS